MIKKIDPPQVKYQLVEKIYRLYETHIQLECEIECANPQYVEYLWEAKNGTVLYRTTSSNLYTHQIRPDLNDDFEIYCTVNNSVQTDFLRQSHTKFIVRFTTDSSSK